MADATRLKMATWNLRWNGSSATVQREIELLTHSDWDVAALQEVSPRAWAALEAAGLAAGAVSVFDGRVPSPDGTRPHGVALLVRNGLGLVEPAPVLGLPRPGRGVGATLTGWDVPVSVCSWHAPNAASSGPAIKMQGYLGFLGWIAQQRHATVAGFDSNHWEIGTDLELAWPDEPAHRWYLEHRFFGQHPPHGLRDAFRDYLGANPDRYAALRSQLPPDGPLAVTYVRGSKQRPVPDRFDYVFMSEELGCLDIEHRYDDARAAGSDHALVIASLAIRGSG